MNAFDLALIAIALTGLVFWIRGGRRETLSDCAFGLTLAVVACGLYFFIFSLTRTAWLAVWILIPFPLALLLCRPLLRRPAGRVLAACLAVLIAAEHAYVSAGNALLVVEPYRTGRGWAFDEPRLGLRREPFVQGIPEMIDRLSAGIPGADKSVRLIFSQRPFPGAQLTLERLHEQNGGNWYHSPDYQSDGWLCPALFKFFPRAPRHIYVRAEEI